MKNVHNQSGVSSSNAEERGFNGAAAWAQSVPSVLDALKVDPAQGLSEGEADRRLRKYGANQLREHRKKNVLQILYDQLKSLIVVLLIAAAAVSFLYQEVLEGWAIVVVIVINTGIGFFTELSAVRSMEALFKLGEVKTRVRRGGTVREVDARELVPGDLVIVEGGDIITADMRVVESSKMQADESALTGESSPVSKQMEPVAEDAVLAERGSMLYKGTAITRGAGTAVVVTTGIQTELGEISSLVEEAKEEQTPLEDRLDKLGYRLVIFTLGIVFLVSLAGVMRGKELFLMIETGIALAVASIPEGLPIVATIALAKGMQLMAKKNALVNRLSSVETLGTTGIIFTDKTGTLTENKMTVTQFLLPDNTISVNGNFKENGQKTKRAVQAENNDSLLLALETGVLCNNATFVDGDEQAGSGDPLEIALLAAGSKAGLHFDELANRFPEEREEAFDPEVKMMATWNKMEAGEYRISVKGAPGTVLEHSETIFRDGGKQPLDEEERQKWLETNRELAGKGYRLLALAFRESDTTEGNPYEELTYIGLVALLDPPRGEVRSAITKCREAGIRVVMVTGDQDQTARYIAESVGLADQGEEGRLIHGRDLPSLEEKDPEGKSLSDILEANIFARVNPQQKLDLIELYQKKGHIVAMTGDGVNDAPALKKADIGIAMGKRGTQVAKEAADMVLVDDAFSTIVAAIEQGRVIFGNIRRFIFYLLSCNVSEVLIVGIATLAGSPLPLLPLQILFLNLVTDVFPALALGVGEGEAGIMQQPPREAKESILTNRHWLGIAGYGLVITASVLGALYIGLHLLHLDAARAVTLSFLTLAFAQLWHVFNMRSRKSGIFRNMITANPWIQGALLLCVILILGALYIPPVAEILKVHPPDTIGWSVVIGMSLVPLFIGQAYKEIASKFSAQR
ncbi:cation-translocating P-type ATPase [Fodinibius sediminis]|uniref:Ca2+-transporting ATPase n=1 Tax=Fodinibius sediminis TaxID=1214077 RepID=A0A521CVJ9_9BACT|nr:cation-transporting P-type ATPase [Fodinibius sediminis]SMO63442.1 Ca2+-transporting ATPase [Fodinibius sediminis]